MTPHASGFRHRQGFGPEPVGRFGGGTSPVKTGFPIHSHLIGRLAEWDGDGWIRPSEREFPEDAPQDDLFYVRHNGEWVAVSGGPDWVTAWDDAQAIWDDGESTWDQTGES